MTRPFPAWRSRLEFPAGACLLAALVLTAVGCDNSKYDAAALAATEFGWEQEAAPDSERIRQLKQDIVANRAILEERINAAGNTGRLYRALGFEYRRLGLYYLALGAWERAMEIETANPAVYYQAGLMAAQSAKLLPDQYDRLMDKAMAYHATAISLQPGLADAYYALAVILIFEKPDPARAATVVAQGLQANDQHVGLMFLAARLAAEEGRVDQARYWYGRIMDSKATAEEKKQAEMNQEALATR